MFQRPYQRQPSTAANHQTPWRLLVESDDAVLAISDFGAYRDAGFDVGFCEGPLIEGRECPLVRGEPCPYAATADVVLFDLGAAPQARLAVLGAMLATRPDLPVVVRTVGEPPDGAHAYATITSSTSVAGQVEVLREAARSRAGRQS